MLEVLSLTFPLFGLIILGFVGGRISDQPIQALGWLNTFIIYFALPAMLFTLVAKTPVDQFASWEFVATNIAITFAVLALTFALGALDSRGNVPEATIQALAGGYGNIGYMGPALAILTFGEKAAIPVAIIFCFENTMHFALAPAMMALSGQCKQSPMELVLDVVRRIVFHPFILATAAGVLVATFQIDLPILGSRLINYLAQAAAPCALFAIGVTLALRPMKRVPGSLFYITPIKLILHPLLMYVGLSHIGDFDETWILTAVLLASLPTATNVYVIAEQYDVWIERASASIMVTTALSIFTVSGLLYAITIGVLPPDLFVGR